MPSFDENHVKLCGGIVVWDGVTQPETQQQGKNAGKLKWTLKVVFPPNCPDLGLYDQLANKKLQESPFRGVLPAGGRMPINQVGPTEFNGMFPGWFCISFKTTLRAPEIYDDSGTGQQLDPMQFGQVVFPGQSVDVLAHCYDYDNAGNKGISGGMDGFQVNLALNSQRQNFGGGGPDTQAAFGGQPQQQGGGQPQQQPAYQQPAQQQPAQQQPAYQQPAQQQPAQQQPAYQQPAQQQPAQQQPAYQQPAQQQPAQQQPAYQQPAQQQPAYQQPAQQQPAQQQPQQATNFMPNQ